MKACALALFVVSALVLPVSAQSVPKLNGVSREWLTRGEKVPLRLFGENLAGATNVLISGPPGLNASIVPGAASSIAVESTLGGIHGVARGDSGTVRVEIQAAPNAALVEREIRVVTPDGVSNPLTINLSPLPQIKSGDNQSRDKALKLSLPVVASGVIQNAAQSDFFKFSGRTGEHVILDVNAYRLGSRLDSSLAVLDANGKELARSEDVAGLDSVLDFEVPAEGEYLVELRDFRYQGGGDYKYRLTAGVLPYVRAAFPFGGQRGQVTEVELKGANLDSSTLLLQLDAGAGLGRQEIRALGGRGLSNPFPFEVSDLPQVNETEPNGSPEQASVVPIPGAINGRINQEKDRDLFKFHVEKGQRILFEIEAFQFGSLLDAVLTLKDAKGKVLRRDDDADGPDSRIDYTFQKSGDFFVSVEDLLNRGGNQYGYRLTAHLPLPDFALTMTRDTVRVHRGGRIPLRCELNPVNGFNQPVRIVCEDLPPGVYAEPLVLEPAGPSAGLLILSASSGASLGSFPLKVFAVADEQGHSVRRAANALSNEKPVKGAFITVLESAPFSISTEALMATVEQNQSEKISVLVERKNGFAGEIRVTPEGFSAGRDPISRSFDFQTLTLKPGESRGTLSLRARTDSEIGARPVLLRAETGGDGALVAEYSPAFPVRTEQIPFVLAPSLKKLLVTALPSARSSAAAEAVFTVKAERRDGFSGAIELKLEGVPDGVAATVPKIPENGAETTVRLVASEKAPTGKNVELKLTGSGVFKDRTYRFPTAPITLTINAAENQDNSQPKLANTK